MGRPTDKWITQSLSQIGEFSDSVKVPKEAAVIMTPLLLQNWSSLLAAHPDQALASFFITGILQGFRVGYHSLQRPFKSAKQNLDCATQHPEVIDRRTCPTTHGRPFPNRFGDIPPKNSNQGCGILL